MEIKAQMLLGYLRVEVNLNNIEQTNAMDMIIISVNNVKIIQQHQSS